MINGLRVKVACVNDQGLRLNDQGQCQVIWIYLFGAGQILVFQLTLLIYSYNAIYILLLYPTLPYLTLPYPTLPNSTQPYTTLTYPAIPNLAYPTLPYPNLSYPNLPYTTLLYPILVFVVGVWMYVVCGWLIFLLLVQHSLYHYIDLHTRHCTN